MTTEVLWLLIGKTNSLPSLATPDSRLQTADCRELCYGRGSSTVVYTRKDDKTKESEFDSNISETLEANSTYLAR